MSAMPIRLIASLALMTGTLVISACGGGGGGSGNNRPTAATLEVLKTGSGTGTVSGTGIDCGSTCNATTTVGATITLTATPASGQRFDSWGGDAASCGSSTSCTFTANSARVVATAAFSVIPVTNVSVSLAGNRMGTVTSNPAGINCTSTAASDCSETYNQGGTVTLTAAVANANNVFSGWSGACSGTQPTCTLMLNMASLSATATFQPINRSLSVNKTGNGTVTSSPAGINCGTACAASFQQGSMISLTAAPASGFTFQGWGGACSGTASCVVTMDADKNVTAAFVSTNVTLTVSKLGNGTVTSAPAGINCGTTCSAPFARGSTVTLTAAAGATDTFQGWSGGGCSGTGTCTPALNGDVTVTASFSGNSGQTPGEFLGLTNANRVVSFDRATPGTFRTAAAITGLNSGETVVAIDTRPVDGLLYGFTNRARIVTIDPVSGTASVKSTLTRDTSDVTDPYTTLNGSVFGIDFNPTVDRLRIVSDAGQNLRVNADSGAVITDANLNPGSPAAVDAAYTFNFNGSTGTQLYVIDTAADKLVLQNPPNNGTLVDVGPLGVAVGTLGGFEIIGTNVDAFAVLKSAADAAAGALYQIDLRTGAATKKGDFTGNEQLISLAAPVAAAPPAPADLALLTASGKIVTVSRAAPETQRTSAFITGVPAAETAVDIDYRPRTGDAELLLLTRDAANTGRLYTLNASTGAATLKSTVGGATPIALTGTVSMDVNPAVDALRIITSDDQNIRVTNIDTGAATSDTVIAPAASSIVGVGYTNSFTNTVSTSLYTVDATGSMLNLQNPPNDGTQVAVGSLGLTSPGTPLGFDINAINNEGLLVAMDGTTQKLFSVNLSTGLASNGKALPAGERFIGTTLRAPKEPETYAVVTGVGNGNGCPTGVVCLARFTHTTSVTYTTVRQPFSLASGVTLMGMDFRPQNGDLVALGSDAKLYSVNPANGDVAVLSTMAPDPMDTDGSPAFATSMIAAANAYGVDFNPVVDRLRIVGSNNVNLRVKVETGETTTDVDVGRPPLAVTGAAYNTANQPVLFGVDSASDRLFTVDTSATGNPGRLTQIGELGVDIEAANGFDIFGADGFMVSRVGGATTLYAVDLTTGAATSRGALDLSGSVGTHLIASSISTVSPNNLFGITETGFLVEYGRNAPGSRISGRALSGIPSGETVVGMDYRTGTPSETLYVVTRINGSNNGKLYTVTPQGQATAVSSVNPGPPPSTTTMFALPANATAFGVDVNQSSGAIRIVTDNGGNIDVNPSSLVVMPQTNLNQTTPVVSSVLYTNSFAGALATQLFDINGGTDTLMRQGKVTPNDGQLFDVKPLGANINNIGGADCLGGENGYCIGVFTIAADGFSTLYRVGLTGAGNALTAVGTLGAPAAGNTADRRVTATATATRFTP